MSLPAPAPKVSVLIVNYQAGDRLRRCLDHLAAQTFRDFEVIVVDNGSSDGSIETARASAQPFALVDPGGNVGFAAGNNRGAERARGEWLALLNPDAYADPDWLERLLAAAARYPWADAFGSLQIDAAAPERLDGAGDVFHALGVPYRGHFGWPIGARPTADGETFAPCAAAALYRRSTFLALGGFDERFFCYGEDVDLGFRLRLSGGRVIQVADAVVHHEGSGISGRQSDFTIYYGNRNRVWLAFKNMPGALYWPLLPFQIAATLVLLARSIRRGQGAVYFRALRDGYLRLFELAGSRAALQRARRASVGEIARAMTWSLRAVTSRATQLRPIEAPSAFR